MELQLRNHILLFVAFLSVTGITSAQTVRVDISAAKAIAFDPDQSLGSSLDILPAKQFEKIFTPEIIKQSLSAGWGPITYRQNTELSIAAWHWNPNGSWSDSKAAEAHVRMKFDYLSDRNEINTAKDFIDKAASVSSFSGSPYQVKCPGSAPVLSRTWLSEELARYLGRGNKVTTR